MTLIKFFQILFRVGVMVWAKSSIYKVAAHYMYFYLYSNNVSYTMYYGNYNRKESTKNKHNTIYVFVITCLLDTNESNYGYCNGHPKFNHDEYQTNL